MRAEEDRPRTRDSLGEAPEAARARTDDRVVRLRLARDEKPPVANGSATPDAQEPLGTWVRDIEALESVVSTWDERERNTVAALERAIDALHKEALTRLIKVLKTSPEASGLLRQAAADPLVYTVLRQHELVRPSLQERVEAALASVRPMLATHGGDVELVSIPAPDTVKLRLLGSCDGCSAAELTLTAGVEKAIREHCPEIRRIERASGGLTAAPSAQRVSPFDAADDRSWLRAARLSDIPDGDILPIILRERSLLLTRKADRVSCFDNACAHLGMPLDAAEVADGVLTCPHHHFQFLLESGECLTVREVQLQAHPTRVRGEDVEVRLT